MTTKEQEIKALEQIKAIVAGLGEDSYLAAAFDGCFELAEDNISNDFLRTPHDSADCLNRFIDKLQKDIAKLTNELLTVKDERNDLQIAYENAIYDKQLAVTTADNRYMDLVVAKNEVKTLTAERDNQKGQILELKAKLYDYMTA
jgi:uncharacterized protein YktA (UPF0223 family)